MSVVVFSWRKNKFSSLYCVQRDPFDVAVGLNDEQKQLYRNQSVPTLLQYLELARDHDTKVMFDVKMFDNRKSCQGHPYNDSFMDVILQTIIKSKIPQQNVRLPSAD